MPEIDHQPPSQLRRGDLVIVIIDREFCQGVVISVDHDRDEVQIHARPRPGWTWVGPVPLSDEGVTWCCGWDGDQVASLHSARALI